MTLDTGIMNPLVGKIRSFLFTLLLRELPFVLMTLLLSWGSLIELLIGSWLSRLISLGCVGVFGFEILRETDNDFLTLSLHDSFQAE